jgi:YD repeat-containing protein
VREIVFTDGVRLLLSDSGIVASNGQRVQFSLNGDGFIERVVADDGRQFLYEYDAQGRLLAVRDLEAARSLRYGYEEGALGRLAMVATAEAAACSTYRGTGVAEQAITADLGASLGYLATPLAGHLAAGEKASFAFTLRESELASTASGSVYLGLIVEGSGGLLPLLPVLPGLTAVASSVQGNRAFALYKLDRAGLKLIEIGATSAGSYQLSLFVAGDANRDGKADGSDAVLIAAAAGLRSGDAGYALALDADANGVIDSLDLQLLMQNTGFTPNQAPVVVAATVTTHEDLDVSAPVASFVTDPEGDRSFFSIVGASHGTARLSGDGRAVIFAPEMGFVGSADFTIRADDGFGQTIQTIAVTISDAALTRIDFVERVLRLDVGEGRQISLIGDFADQSGVELPVSYVSLSSSNVGSGTIASGGRISAVGKGSGVLVAERGELRAATSFTVGTPTETVAAYVFAVGLDVYPGAVALTENGGRRQIVASLAGQIDLAPASSGTRYFVSDDRVLSVSADGLITGKAAGSATVTVINGGGEFVLSAMVEAPISGPALLGSRGGIVEGADGSVVAVAAGALTGNTQVSIAALAAAALPLAMPEEMRMAGAFRLESATTSWRRRYSWRFRPRVWRPAPRSSSCATPRCRPPRGRCCRSGCRRRPASSARTAWRALRRRLMPASRSRACILPVSPGKPSSGRCAGGPTALSRRGSTTAARRSRCFRHSAAALPVGAAFSLTSGFIMTALFGARELQIISVPAQGSAATDDARRRNSRRQGQRLRDPGGQSLHPEHVAGQRALHLGSAAALSGGRR